MVSSLLLVLYIFPVIEIGKLDISLALATCRNLNLDGINSWWYPLSPQGVIIYDNNMRINFRTKEPIYASNRWREVYLDKTYTCQPIIRRGMRNYYGIRNYKVTFWNGNLEKILFSYQRAQSALESTWIFKALKAFSIL